MLSEHVLKKSFFCIQVMSNIKTIAFEIPKSIFHSSLVVIPRIISFFLEHMISLGVLHINKLNCLILAGPMWLFFIRGKWPKT